jgi:diguanylate cyclase (GGDEF)-like protein/PAS domain S-box-containing protein
MRRLFAHRQVDEELRKSEARYRTVLDAAFDAIVTITPDGIVRWFNRGAERIFGYRAEEVIGQPVTLLMPERYRELCVAGLHRYLRTGEAHVVGGTTELVGLRKDGSEFPIEMSLGETYEDGERLFTGVIRDVTERKRTEDALREARDRFRSIFDHAPIGVAMVSLEGRYVQVNRSLCEILGYTEDQLQALTWQEITHPDDLAASSACARRLVEGEFPSYHLDERFLHADGNTVWASLSVSLVRDAEGEPLYFVSQIQDASERKRFESALRESEQRFRGSFERAATGMALVGTDGRFLRVNRSLCEILGYPERELLGKTFQEITHPEDLDADLDQVRRMLDGEIRTYQMEKRYFHKEGHVVWALLSVSLVHDEEDEPLYFISQIQDVSERKRFEEALERLSQQQEMVLKSAGEGIFGLDLHGNVTFVNPAASDMTEWNTQDLLGRPMHNLLHHTKPDGAPYPSEECPIYAAFTTGTTHSRDDEVFWRKDGTSFPVEYTSTPIFEDGEIVGAVVTFRDITERKALEQQLQHQAFHDPLSGLPNRVLFMDRLEHALTRANRRGTKVAVLFMDLDNFKVVNDSLGHEVGDQLLVAVAERLKACLRPEDTAARLGGDEFTILVEDIASVDEAVQIAERIADILRPPIALEEQEVFATVSTGIALNSTAQEQPADLLRHADLAMYRAKRRGKARYEVFEPSMDAKAVQRLILETGLRRALVRQQFRVYYQPIVALDNGKVAGVEALVRWEHPQRGLLLPEEFLSVAEETGLIVRIGQWVLREAGKQARIWQERYPGTPPLTISVNLSPRQFFHPELVAEVLEGSEIDPASLQLEITEGAMTTNGTDSADRRLRNLKRMGVQLAIDDFGLGYSSLSYLKRFPVDFLKIDRSFIAGLRQAPNGVSTKDTEIVKAMIELTHALGLKVIAEGVETSEQLARLRNMECDFAQGNYFSEPLPSEELAVNLAEDSTDRD